MYKIELHQTIRRIIRLFYQLRIWQCEEESARRKTGWKLFYLIFFVLFLIFVTITAIISDNKVQSLFMMNMSIFIGVIVIKQTYLLWNKEEILAFLNANILTHSIEDHDESKKINKKIDKFMKYCLAYLYMIACACFIFAIASLPIFSSEKKLPLFIPFTLDCEYSEIIYWITYIFVELGAICSAVFSFVNVMIWYLMLIYSIEYQVLGNKIRKLGKGVKDKTTAKQEKISKSVPPKSFSQDLIGLIKAHREIYETIQRFLLCFSKLFMAQIATSAISLCVATYNLAYSSEATTFFQTCIFIFGLLYGIYDIFLISYLANEITVASDQLSYCLFESNWTDQPGSCKKCIIIFCEILQQPQQLTILIYPLNLEMFSRIMNGAYSMFNILKTLNTK